MAEATTWDDELITADLDLDRCTLGRTTIFDFAAHRRRKPMAPSPARSAPFRLLAEPVMQTWLGSVVGGALWTTSVFRRPGTR